MTEDKLFDQLYKIRFSLANCSTTRVRVLALFVVTVFSSVILS